MHYNTTKIINNKPYIDKNKIIIKKYKNKLKVILEDDELNYYNNNQDNQDNQYNKKIKISDV